MIFFIVSSRVNAVEVRWLGVAGLSLTDQTTTLLFDPTFTKPTLLNWMNVSPFLSNPSLVTEELGKINIKKADAVFASHTHFDHAVDISEVALQTDATIYGGNSLKNIIDHHTQSNKLHFKDLTDGTVLKIGSFTITAIRRGHAPILGIFKFAPGDVSKNFSFGLYEYKEGEVWCYLIEHPDGTFLIDQGSHFFEGNSRFKDKIDFYFVGVANKTHINDLVYNNIEKINAKKVFPIHFDFFFLQSNWLETLRLPGVQLEKIEATLQNLSPPKEFIIPTRYAPLNLKKE